LVSTEFRSSNWHTIIAGVHGFFSGPITYAANQGSESAIRWWDHVDFIGVDAYYPLTGVNDPTLDELKAAWVPIAAGLKALSISWGKPIIFTEVGYRSQDGANRHPWDYMIGGTLDLQEQADLYQALFESLFNQDWFAGTYWWSWDPDPLQGGPCDMSYSPHDKPAEAVLRQRYGVLPKSSEETPGIDYSRVSTVYSDSLAMGWADWSWGGTYNFAFTETVASGVYAISADAQNWGAVALHYDNFDSSPYYWLELYVYKTNDISSVAVFANDEYDQILRTRPVEDCRYTENQPITAGVWTRVRIPLKDLNASNRMLQRISIGNNRNWPFTFYVDDIRLVGALWKSNLPLVLKP
jgi:hypothetical protein